MPTTRRSTLPWGWRRWSPSRWSTTSATGAGSGSCGGSPCSASRPSSCWAGHTRLATLDTPGRDQFPALGACRVDPPRRSGCVPRRPHGAVGHAAHHSSRARLRCRAGRPGVPATRFRHQHRARRAHAGGPVLLRHELDALRRSCGGGGGAGAGGPQGAAGDRARPSSSPTSFSASTCSCIPATIPAAQATTWPSR